jgi:hypothetical protein
VPLLSSRATFFYKRIFPFLFVAFLITVPAVPLLRGARSLPPEFFIAPIVMLVIFYFVMKKLIFDLVDEVVDQGDHLLIKNGGRQERVALSDIMNINYASLTSPPRVTLSLRRPTVFGSEVTFCAPLRFVPFSSSRQIEELIKRVDAARRAARR